MRQRATAAGQSNNATQKECVIKGNISKTGERIYHVPGGEFYSRAVISLANGERWFCSEAEAQAARLAAIATVMLRRLSAACTSRSFRFRIRRMKDYGTWTMRGNSLDLDQGLLSAAL